MTYAGDLADSPAKGKEPPRLQLNGDFSVELMDACSLLWTNATAPSILHGLQVSCLSTLPQLWIPDRPCGQGMLHTFLAFVHEFQLDYLIAPGGGKLYQVPSPLVSRTPSLSMGHQLNYPKSAYTSVLRWPTNTAIGWIFVSSKVGMLNSNLCSNALRQMWDNQKMIVP